MSFCSDHLQRSLRVVGETRGRVSSWIYGLSRPTHVGVRDGERKKKTRRPSIITKAIYSFTSYSICLDYFPFHLSFIATIQRVSKSLKSLFSLQPVFQQLFKFLSSSFIISFITPSKDLNSTFKVISLAIQLRRWILESISVLSRAPIYFDYFYFKHWSDKNVFLIRLFLIFYYTEQRNIFRFFFNFYKRQENNIIVPIMVVSQNKICMVLYCAVP